jgi:hypothetical protein
MKMGRKKERKEVKLILYFLKFSLLYLRKINKKTFLPSHQFLRDGKNKKVMFRKREVGCGWMVSGQHRQVSWDINKVPTPAAFSTIMYGWQQLTLSIRNISKRKGKHPRL